MPGNQLDNTQNSVVAQAIAELKRAIESGVFTKVEVCLHNNIRILPVGVLQKEFEQAQQRLKILDEEVKKQLESKQKGNDLYNLSCPEYGTTIMIVILLEDYLKIKKGQLIQLPFLKLPSAVLVNKMPALSNNTQAMATPALNR